MIATVAGSKTNFVLAYALLVVVPLLGLVGVLKAGRGLTAPAAIDGTWRVQVAPTQTTFAPCDQVLAAAVKTLAISQSGKNFTLSVPNESQSPMKISGSGTLEGSTLRAALTSSESLAAEYPAAGAAAEGRCNSAHPLTLLAALDRQAGADVLNGTFSVTDCPSCNVVAFRAERKVVAVPKGVR